MGVAIAWIYLAYPFGNLAAPYTASPDDVSAAQRAVDYVRANGGLTFWSYPEARYRDIQVFGARMLSRPHPEDLWRVHNYDGFEGLYGDRITVTRPGGEWDRVLIDYLQGHRERWPSVITGVDFHSFDDSNRWFQLDGGQTVLWTESNDESLLLDALASGRGYSAFQGRTNSDLRLWDYSLRRGDREAIAGETLGGAGESTLTLQADWSGGYDEPILVDIVRDGELLDSRVHTPPLRIEWADDSSGGHHYYRVRLRAGTTEILTNPIFSEQTP